VAIQTAYSLKSGYGVTKEKNMKKYSILLGFFVLLLSTLSAQSYSGGSGTSGDPYWIADKDDLKYLSEHTGEWDKHFIQTADITFITSDFQSGGDFYNSGKGFIPIGGGIYGTTDFGGSFNGNGYSIENLFIYRTSESRVGFFGRTDYSGDLDDINLVNVDITGGGITAALVGQPYGTINDCGSSGSVSGTGTVGGLVGQVNSGSSIADCYSTASVSSSGETAGGFAGSSSDNISSCFSTGNVEGTKKVGGFIGSFQGGMESKISNCYSLGDVTRLSGTEISLGGFCGSVRSDMMGGPTIEYCYSIGSVTCGGATDKGFVGYEEEEGPKSSIIYTNNFWDSEASNQSTATGATGKDTDAMKGITAGNTISDWGWSTDIWERIGNNYPRLINNPDPTLPITLSTFTADFINNTPTLCWETQSEIDNLGWNIYRNDVEVFSSSSVLTDEMIPGNGTTTEPSYYNFVDNENLEIGQTYYYWLESIDYSGISQVYSRVAQITIPDPSVNPPQITPPILYDFKNVPNPLNSSTKFQFTLDKASMVSVSIYNILGELVKTLPEVMTQPDETAHVYWNGKDNNGKDLTPGVYFYNLIMNGKTIETKKLIIMK